MKRAARLASLFALIIGMSLAAAGPVAAGSPVTEDGFVLVGSDRAWAAISGQAWQPNEYVPDCTWDVQVSVVIADRLVAIGSGAPAPHGDVEVWVSNDGDTSCPASISGYYGIRGITSDVSIVSLSSASLENNYNVRVSDGTNGFEVCLTLDWNATEDPHPVTGPRERLAEVSRQAPAEVTGHVSLYCGDPEEGEPLTLETAHDDDVEVGDAHLARSQDRQLNLP